MKLKFILPSFIAMACALSFTACSDDDDDDEEKLLSDIEEIENKIVAAEAVGNYNVTITPVIYNGEKFYEISSETDNGTAIAALDDKNLTLTVKDEDGDDVYKLQKIAEASNGFTFDVEDFTDGDDVFKGYNAYELKSSDGSSVKYHGGYISATNTLEFYYEAPRKYIEEILTAELLSDEEFIQGLATIYAIDEETADELVNDLDALLAQFKLLIRITAIKK